MAVASVAAPAMHPLHQTRSMPDVLIDIAAKLAKPLKPVLPWKSYEAALQAAFGDQFSKAREQGGLWSEAKAAAQTASPASNEKALAYAEPIFDGPEAQYPLHFLPFVSQAFLDGSLAHLPWLQELPDPMTTAMWSTWVEINPKKATELGIAHGDLVEVTSTQGSLRAPAVVSPAIAPNVIAMPMGQGHPSFTRYATGRGSNPIGILAPRTESETGTLAWAATRVRIARVEGNSGLIQFARDIAAPRVEHR